MAEIAPANTFIGYGIGPVVAVIVLGISLTLEGSDLGARFTMWTLCWFVVSFALLLVENGGGASPLVVFGLGTIQLGDMVVQSIVFFAIGMLITTPKVYADKETKKEHKVWFTWIYWVGGLILVYFLQQNGAEALVVEDAAPFIVAGFIMTIVAARMMGKSYGSGIWVRRTGFAQILFGMVFIVGYSAPESLDLTSIEPEANRLLVLGAFPFLNGLLSLVMGSYYSPFDGVDPEALAAARAARRAEAQRQLSQPETVWAGEGGGIIDQDADTDDEGQT